LLLAAPAAVQAQNNFKYLTNTGKGTAVVVKYTNNVGAGNVTVSNFVSCISNNAFNGATYVTGITIPSSVTNICQAAFNLCTNLTNASIAGSATIGLQAFQGCAALTSVTLTAATSIGGYAFNACTSLPSITIPSTVTNIGASNQNAFDQCSALAAITVATANPYYTSSNGVVFNKNLTTLVEFPCGLGGSYKIPGTVTTIGSEAFGNNYLLTNITIPSSVTNIQDIAFEYCALLTRATFTGNAPANDGTVFSGDYLTVYYATGTTGWSNPWNGELALPWNMTMKLNSLKFPTQTNYVGFTITGPTNFGAVVQVCTNLGIGTWTPLSTLLLTNPPGGASGSNYFSELGKTNMYSGRFYTVIPQ